MRCLVDTGILLRLFDRNDPRCRSCREAVASLMSGGHELVAPAQIAVEFLNVSTRPRSARGGYGQPGAQALRRLRFLEATAGVVLSESVGSYLRRRGVDEACPASGVPVHEARLVSVMIYENVSHVLTLNPSDFERYGQFVVLTPDAVNAARQTADVDERR